MKPVSFMLIAGEASGDALAAELVRALRPGVLAAEDRPSADAQPLTTALAPRFFGAGGPHMAAAGVELVVDLTAHAVFGLWEALKQYGTFRRIFQQLFRLALERQPDVIVLVDYAGFNRRFAAAIKEQVRRRRGTFNNWEPKIVYFVSPQVWASRPGRAVQLARDVDLLLSIFPFEKEWYAARVPQLPVEFVGHPLVDRYANGERGMRNAERTATSPLVVLLPGSRRQELRRHWPVMLEAARLLARDTSARFRAVLPDATLADAARRMAEGADRVEIVVGDLAGSLASADLAIASSGTVTLECAFFGVPAVVLYKLSWPTYLVARQLVRVPCIAMPNLLARQALYPEFIQHAATPENIARQARDLLTNAPRRERIQARLAEVIQSLGPPGATRRAAGSILRLLFGPAGFPPAGRAKLDGS